MGYNPTNFVKICVEPGIMAEARINHIDDGLLQEFLTPAAMTKWKQTEPTHRCIRLTLTVSTPDEMHFQELFTYSLDKDGKVMVSSKSKLSKYLSYYKKLPAQSDIVKVLSNKDGLWRIVLT